MVRHRNYEAWIDRPTGTDPANVFWKDATFKMVSGNANAAQGAVSFESENYPGYFLRHSNYVMWIHRKDGSDLFNKDSSFYIRHALASPGTFGIVSFESVNYPGYYVGHANYRVQIRKLQNTQLYREDCSWRLSRPIVDFHWNENTIIIRHVTIDTNTNKNGDRIVSIFIDEINKHYRLQDFGSRGTNGNGSEVSASGVAAPTGSWFLSIFHLSHSFPTTIIFYTIINTSVFHQKILSFLSGILTDTQNHKSGALSVSPCLKLKKIQCSHWFAEWISKMTEVL